MKITILDDITASPKLSGAERRAIACSSGCRLKNGDILCVYRVGKQKHSRDGVFQVQRSTTGGRTWSEPITIYDGMSRTVPESVHAGGVCQGKDGTVYAMFTAVDAKDPDAYIFSSTGRQLEQRFYISQSSDNGQTWAPAVLQSIPNSPPLRYINTRPFVLPDGNLLVPLEITTEQKTQEVMMTRYVIAKKSFEPAVRCAFDPTDRLSFGDPKLIRMPNGQLVMWLWVFVTATEKTVEAHVCVSDDDGRTWTKPRATEVSSQNSALLALPDGRVIVAGNVRVPPEGIRLWASRDSGKTWDTSVTVQLWDARKHKTIGEVIKVDPSGVDPTIGKLWEALPGFPFGCPDLMQVDERTCLLTFYAVADGIEVLRACRFTID